MVDASFWKRTWKNIQYLLRKHGINRYYIQSKIARRENTIAYLFGLLFIYLAIALLVPLVTAWFYHEDTRPWLYPVVLCGALGLPLLLRYEAAEHTRPSAAMFVVTTGWLLMMVFGAIPYMLYGMGAVDAFFETMSGFTTTGATIMLRIEDWPHSLLLWRSFTQWLGGAGIVMIFVTVFPMLGVSGRNLAKSEFSGLDVQNISLRIQEEATKFHYIYLAFSVVQLLLLLITGIGMYDSLTVMFSTVSTGGFSPHTESIAFFASPIVEWIIIVFMFLGGVNFYLHFQAFKSGRRGTYWGNSEFRTYAMIVILASLIGLVLLWGEAFSNIEEGVRTSAFQVISCITSTGFATQDFALWNGGVVFLLLALIVIGGCAGSTAGGMKVFRFVLSRKFVYASIYKTVHPKAIYSIKLDGRNIGEHVITSMMAVAMCYLATALFATVALTLMGLDPTVSLSAAVTTLSNCGPGIGPLGPMGTFGTLPDAAKVILTFTMWAGRLEFLTVFAAFTPLFWRELLRYNKN